MSEGRRSGPTRHLRQRFRTGRALLLPLFITVRPGFATREILPPAIPVEEGAKIMVSGGIVGPSGWERSAAAPPGAGPALS